MTIFAPAHGKVIDTGGRSLSFLRLIGIGLKLRAFAICSRS
jgi:hypothetical protein